MASYVDGFVVPIAREHLENYRKLVEQVAAIWKEHGALDYREYVGDDLNLEGTGSFLDQVGASDQEVVIFGWVEFESRAARDAINEKISTDPRMAELVGAADSGFNPERMAYGGFRAFVPPSDNADA